MIAIEQDDLLERRACFVLEFTLGGPLAKARPALDVVVLQLAAAFLVLGLGGFEARTEQGQDLSQFGDVVFNFGVNSIFTGRRKRIR